MHFHKLSTIFICEIATKFSVREYLKLFWFITLSRQDKTSIILLALMPDDFTRQRESSSCERIISIRIRILVTNSNEGEKINLFVWTRRFHRAWKKSFCHHNFSVKNLVFSLRIQDSGCTRSHRRYNLHSHGANMASFPHRKDRTWNQNCI